MAPFSRVRAIAFDMDQTLIDFEASRLAGIEAALARIHGAGLQVDRDRFIESHQSLARAEDERYHLTGKWAPTAERFRELCIQYAMPHDGFAEELAEAYVDARYASLHQYPETRAALEALQPRYPLFLVTNGPSSHQHREIEVTGLSPYFRKVFVVDDFGMRKPQEPVFDMIRDAAGVRDDEMLIVGDNPLADIDVPRKRGWATVWVVRDDMHRARRAFPGRADAVVRTVAEVPPLLGM